DYFELEAIAFFLSGIGLTVCASFNETYALKQLIAIGLGIAVYLIMLLLIKDVHVAGILRYPAAVASIGILAANLVLAKTVNGTLNWIDLGFFSIQPSELVKITFILVGAVSLEKLLSITSLTKYVLFSLACVGALFLMKDFGTALIFFFTFILIAFMRSGNIRTIVLICAVALMGAMLIIYFKPYVANRFAAYRHVWDFIDTTGYQQTRVLIYSASGGLFGLGIGEGKLRDVYAASTDLIFGLICEEMGLILGIAVLLSFVGIAFLQ
ncbi:MAG: FtsW/RodA/SpoVE family cell cycle protein, partial [Acutalibacteraceae bacterium]|nr:FtsW/RodA/SpoVE family cell cycle protein [Acutalibacteraceae bacterium]